MDVIGVKGAQKDSKLLGKFLMHLAAKTSNNQWDGTYLPKGVANLLGLQTYAQVLQENNFFLTNIATVPVNLEYSAWFAVIDPNNTLDNALVSLNDHLTRQPWFLRIESVNCNKCLLVTTKQNLPEARAWLDEHLEPMVRQSIPPGIDPLASLLLWRLDKLVYTTTTHTYADISKKQFSLAPNLTAMVTTSSKPPRKCQATLLNYNSDQLMEATSTSNATASTVSSDTTANTPPTPVTPIHALTMELMSLKQELLLLKETIAMAVAQIKSAITSLLDANQTTRSQAMEIDANQNTSSAPNADNQPQFDILSLITNLKHEIATIVLKTHATLQQQAIAMLTTNHLSSTTWA